MQSRDELGRYLNALGLLGLGVEVGVYRGEFARQILRTWRGQKLILVDPWMQLSDYRDSWGGSNEKMQFIYDEAKKLLRNYDSRVEFLRMRSEEASAVIA